MSSKSFAMRLQRLLRMHFRHRSLSFPSSQNKKHKKHGPEVLVEGGHGWRRQVRCSKPFNVLNDSALDIEFCDIDRINASNLPFEAFMRDYYLLDKPVCAPSHPRSVADQIKGYHYGQ